MCAPISAILTQMIYDMQIPVNILCCRILILLGIAVRCK